MPSVVALLRLRTATCRHRSANVSCRSLLSSCCLCWRRFLCVRATASPIASELPPARPPTHHSAPPALTTCRSYGTVARDVRGGCAAAVRARGACPVVSDRSEHNCSLMETDGRLHWTLFEASSMAQLVATDGEWYDPHGMHQTPSVHDSFVQK